MFDRELDELRVAGLSRELRSISGAQGPRVVINSRQYINFSSNDYLGLANHPGIIKAAKKAMEDFGFGACASRLLAGGSIVHKELEEEVARFKRTEAAIVFNSGYAANTGAIPSIARDGDAIFSDELNHASIIDGCRLSRAKTYVYRHRDVENLAGLLQDTSAKRKVVITDTVFSMDGDIAPLKDIYGLCRKHSAILYIDDAHGTGTIGDGMGALTHFNIKPEPWIIQMGTFSKALGSYGAFIAGSKDVIEWIVNTARSFIFSTALPSCIASASIAALKLIENDDRPVKKLWANRDKLISGIKDRGYDIMGSETPIIPVMTGDIDSTLRISDYLFSNGIYAPAIRPPTVTAPRIRITVTAAHSDEDIEGLLDALQGIGSYRV